MRSFVFRLLPNTEGMLLRTCSSLLAAYRCWKNLETTEPATSTSTVEPFPDQLECIDSWFYETLCCCKASRQSDQDGKHKRCPRKSDTIWQFLVAPVPCNRQVLRRQDVCPNTGSQKLVQKSIHLAPSKVSVCASLHALSVGFDRIERIMENIGKYESFLEICWHPKLQTWSSVKDLFVRTARAPLRTCKLAWICTVWVVQLSTLWEK
jgi:hypothetical protein